MRVRYLILVGVLALAALPGCPVGPVVVDDDTDQPPPEDPEGDGGMASARFLMAEGVSDSLNVETGDTSDFKWFETAEEGDIEVSVDLQSNAMRGDVSLQNAYGDIITQRAVNPGDGSVRLTHDAAAAGRYFVVISAEEGSTDYSVSHNLTAAGPPPVDYSAEREAVMARALELANGRDWRDARSFLDDALSDPNLQPFPEAELLREACDLVVRDRYDDARELLRNADRDLIRSLPDLDTTVAAIDRQERRDIERENRPDDPPDDPPDTTQDDTPPNGGDDTADTPPDDPPERGAVRATIAQVQTGGDGAILTMTSCSGVEVGDEGEIDGTSFEVRVTDVSGSNCRGTTTAHPSEIGSRRRVNF